MTDIYELFISPYIEASRNIFPQLSSFSSCLLTIPECLMQGWLCGKIM